MDSLKYGNDFEKSDIAKNASFKSYGVIYLPRMPPTRPESQNMDTNGFRAM